MTYDEIIHMLADQKTDTLIAEKVMGWKKKVNTSWSSFSAQVDGAEREWWVDSDDIYAASENWSPTKNISDAWKVVEWLEEHPKEILLSITRKGATHESLKWWATLRECKGRQKDYFVEAESAALAICRAALLTTLPE